MCLTYFVICFMIFHECLTSAANGAEQLHFMGCSSPPPPPHNISEIIIFVLLHKMQLSKDFHFLLVDMLFCLRLNQKDDRN